MAKDRVLLVTAMVIGLLAPGAAGATNADQQAIVDKQVAALDQGLKELEKMGPRIQRLPDEVRERSEQYDMGSFSRNVFMYTGYKMEDLRITLIRNMNDARGVLLASKTKGEAEWDAGGWIAEWFANIASSRMPDRSTREADLNALYYVRAQLQGRLEQYWNKYNLSDRPDPGPSTAATPSPGPDAGPTPSPAVSPVASPSPVRPGPVPSGIFRRPVPSATPGPGPTISNVITLGKDYIVKKGDSLWSIAKQVCDLLVAAGAKPAPRNKRVQRILLESAVFVGPEASDDSRDVPARDKAEYLANLNNRRFPKTLYTGDRFRIPSKKAWEDANKVKKG